MTKGVVEVDKEDGGRPASSEGGGGSKEYVQRSFDLRTQEGLATYWAKLAQMSVDYRSVLQSMQSCMHPPSHSSMHSVVLYSSVFGAKPVFTCWQLQEPQFCELILAVVQTSCVGQCA